MTASRRGLAVLSAIAAALALIVVLEPPRTGIVGARQLVPGLAPERVERVALRRAAGGAVDLARDDGGWRVTAPSPGPADAAAVADLLSALAVARWDRTVPVTEARGTGLDAPRIVVELGGARTTRISIGAAVPATGQVWVRVGDGAALLVPAWVATAADRDLASLRQRRLAPIVVAQVTGIEIHGGADLVLAGSPLEVRGDGWSVRAHPDRVRALVDAIAALVAADFPAGDAPAGGGGARSIRVLGPASPVDLVEAGRCDERTVRVDGSAGAACVDEGAWREVARRAGEPAADGGPTGHRTQRAADDAGAPAAVAWADPRPVDAASLAELTWRRTGVTLRRRGGATALVVSGGERAADEETARSALSALSAPARVVPAPAEGPGEPVLEVRRADGGASSLALVRTPDGPALRREREPVALVLSSDARAALDLDEPALRDRGLVSEEATALARVVVRAGGREAVVSRGAAVGEWTLPEGLHPEAVAAAALVLSGLRAERFLPVGALGGVRLVVEATFDPPPVSGATEPRHLVEIGGARPDGCAARVDGQVVALARDVCEALLALAPR